LHRIDRASVVSLFQNARNILEGHAKSNSVYEVSEDELFDLAERGLLLSYVLCVREQPCALAFGTLFRDTLLVHHFKHDTKIGHLSPGTVLQTLMMKDLVEHKLARRIDYGFGEPRYRLTNDLDERVTVIALRTGIVNQSLISAHRSFVRSLNGIKRLVQWVPSDGLGRHHSLA
jgi:CelD/BcsL family acetyltransferase involved in cellulose biosynthesis